MKKLSQLECMVISGGHVVIDCHDVALIHDGTILTFIGAGVGMGTSLVNNPSATNVAVKTALGALVGASIVPLMYGVGAFYWGLGIAGRPQTVPVHTGV